MARDSNVRSFTIDKALHIGNKQTGKVESNIRKKDFLKIHHGNVCVEPTARIVVKGKSENFARRLEAENQ